MQPFIHSTFINLIPPTDNKMYNILQVIGRGIGQVMFQCNAISGLLMLIGIAYSSWTLALLALLGNITSTLTAYLHKYSHDKIMDGLYGFNGTLVGIAIGVFMRINIWSLSLLIVGSALSSVIARQFNCQDKLPALTAPFILSVWLLLICKYLFPSLMLPSMEATHAEMPDFLLAFSLNIGQVMFQGNMVTGVLFLIAIFINSRLNAFYTAWGALLPLVMILLPTTSMADFNMGLLGYNAVLCAIATGKDLSFNSLIWSTFAVMLSIALQVGGMRLGITTLTAPFVLSVWLINLIIQHHPKTTIHISY